MHLKKEHGKINMAYIIDIDVAVTTDLVLVSIFVSFFTYAGCAEK